MLECGADTTPRRLVYCPERTPKSDYITVTVESDPFYSMNDW